MKTLGNILWLLLGGGIILFIEYAVSGFMLCLTIIGIPFGIQCFKLAVVSLAPFGTTIREDNTNDGCLALFFNILWILIGGLWIALTHVIFGIIFAITIIGIPFARQHFKLAGLALVPFGKIVE